MLFRIEDLYVKCRYAVSLMKVAAYNSSIQLSRNLAEDILSPPKHPNTRNPAAHARTRHALQAASLIEKAPETKPTTMVGSILHLSPLRSLQPSHPIKTFPTRSCTSSTTCPLDQHAFVQYNPTTDTGGGKLVRPGSHTPISLNRLTRTAQHDYAVPAHCSPSAQAKIASPSD